MATWAFKCTRCSDPKSHWFVPCDTVAEFSPETRIVHVRVGKHWVCAQLDRDHRVAVEAGLLRTVVATDAATCADCQDSQ